MSKPDTNNAALLSEHEDRKIEEAISRKLSAIMTWDTTDVQVKVENGTALLSGTVADTKSLEQTVLVVFTVKGVRMIENKIKIRREGIASMVSRTASGISSITDQADNKQ